MNTGPLAGFYFDETQYFEFGGLTRNPFPMAPDDSGFFSTLHIEKIIDNFLQAILSKKGFMLFTGEVGLGKTTIIRRIISELDANQVHTALILNSFYQENELLQAINKDFGIDVTAAEQANQLELLNDFLLEKHQNGINCAIVIDDAQNLTFESLELIRMISNLEADSEKLVQIMLVGQTELLHRMESRELRPLKSRVAVWEQPFALDRTETRRYVRYKLNIAGDTGRIQIDNSTLNRLFTLTQGNIRKINIIMDKAMSKAFKSGSLVIHKKYIKDVFDDASKGGKRHTNPYITIWITILLILIIGWSAGIALFYHFKIKPESNPAETYTPDQVVQKTISQSADPNPRTPAPVLDDSIEPPLKPAAPPQQKTEILSDSIPAGSNDETSKVKETQDKPEEVSSTWENRPEAQFLNASGLINYLPEFKDFLDNDNLNEIRGSIYEKTGLELVVIPKVTQAIQNKYDVFRHKQNQDTDPRYYLFWYPKMRINKFHMGYEGREIKPIQRALKEKGHYNYKIDGIVGPILIQGVAGFQELNQLETTGFPDPETLFLLNH